MQGEGRAGGRAADEGGQAEHKQQAHFMTQEGVRSLLRGPGTAHGLSKSRTSWSHSRTPAAAPPSVAPTEAACSFPVPLRIPGVRNN